MAKTMILVLCFSLLGTPGVLASPSDQSQAAKHYMAGMDAWSDGAVDTAITEWRTALQLKPSSSLTKDRLIMAMAKKVELLEKELAELKEMVLSKEPDKPKGIVITMTGNPVPQTQPASMAPTTGKLTWRPQVDNHLDSAAADTVRRGTIEINRQQTEIDRYWGNLSANLINSRGNTQRILDRAGKAPGEPSWTVINPPRGFFGAGGGFGIINRELLRRGLLPNR